MVGNNLDLRGCGAVGNSDDLVFFPELGLCGRRVDISFTSSDQVVKGGVVMIDLCKALDIVDRKLLLKKLQVYGLNTNSLKWFQSYLSGRYQKVCGDGKLSERYSLRRGVFLVLLFFCSS